MTVLLCRHCGRTYETENLPTGCDPEWCEAFDPQAIGASPHHAPTGAPDDQIQKAVKP